MKCFYYSNNWVKTEAISVISSFCFDDNNNFLTSEQIVSILSNLKEKDDIKRFISRLNGLFAIIINFPNCKLLAIDKTRIYPLFYRFREGNLEVSDLSKSLMGFNSKIDKVSEEEYFYLGYTLQGKTLINGIKQVKPACFLEFENNQIVEYEFYSMMVSQDEITSYSYDQCKEKFICILDKVFDRIVNNLNGRQVVVPLSGGYDSRLIISMLKNKGYTNVISYTVGENMEQEQQIAKKVANILEYPIYHIDYSDENFIMQDFYSEEFRNMIDFVGSATNFMWLFEYNAIKWLQKENIMSKDAVFMPGHCGDFIAGSHFQKNDIIDKYSEQKIILNMLLNAFVEYNQSIKSFHLRNEIKKMFKENTSHKFLSYSIFLNFIMKNRLAQCINNSSRIYNFFEYNVIFPFWDTDIVDFFRCLPFEFLFKKKLYNDVLENDIFVNLNLNFVEPPKDSLFFKKQKIKNILKIFLPRFIHLKCKGNIDVLGEKYLTCEMVKELIDAGVMKDENDFLSQNEIMKSWYLLYLKSQF